MPRIIITCSGCGGPFKVWPCAADRAYCNRACYDSNKPLDFSHTDALEYYRQCGSLVDTAAAFNVTPKAIAYVVKRNPSVVPLMKGRQGKRPRKVFTCAERDVIHDYSKTDLSVDAICLKYSIKYSDLVKIRIRNGVKSRRDARDIDWSYIVEQIAGGRTWTEVSVEQGVCRAYIKKHLAEHRPDLIPVFKKTKGREQEILRVYASGKTLAETADELDLTAGAIRKVIKKLQPRLLDRPKRGRTELFDNDRIIALFAEGDKSYKAVGDLVGASENVVRTCIAKKAPHLIKENWAKRRGFAAAKAHIRASSLLKDLSDRRC